MERNSFIRNFLYIQMARFMSPDDVGRIAVINRPNDSNKSLEFSPSIDMRACPLSEWVTLFRYTYDGSVA